MKHAVRGRLAAPSALGVMAALATAVAGIAFAAPAGGFGVSDETPSIGQPVTFAAEDPCVAPVTCDWAFGDGDTGSGAAVEHAYAALGSYRATLTVDDPTDEEPPATADRLVTVVNGPPVAQFTVSDAAPAKQQLVTFDAATSSDPDGDPLTHAWDLDGDGGFDDGDAVTATRAYAASGSVTVRLRVSDGREEDVTEHAITVGNRAPSARLSASKSSVAAGEDVTFDSAGSSDPDGDALARAWDLDGDGSFETVGGERRTFALSGAGAHLVRVKVTDSDGAGDVANVTVTVAGQPPAAGISASTTAPLSSEPVTFTSTSTDADGPIASLAWDLDDDGFDDGFLPTLTHAFALPGSYTVRLRVTDGDVVEATAGVVVAVQNRAPIADVATSSTTPLTQESVTFTSTSFDPDGTVASYSWDLDGDGFDDGSESSLTTTFGIPGQRSVRLRVVDDLGVHDIATVAVTALNRNPVASFTASPTPIPQVEPVTFTSSSTDPEGRLHELAWDLDDDGVYEAKGSTATLTFTTTAPHAIRLKVTDLDGGVDFSSQVVVPGNSPPTGAVTVDTAAPTTGVPVTFSAAATDPEGKQLSYWWLEDPDAECDGSRETSTITCEYSVPGSHTARVRITDADGAVITSEAEVVLPNRNPVVLFSYSPDPFAKNAAVTFTAQATDPENRRDALAWDLDGDGEYDDATGPTATWRYTRAVSVTVGLRATDLDGGSGSARLVLTPGNKAPTASFMPGAAVLGTASAFTATADDEDGAIASYAWDFDGDGVFDDGDAPHVSWTFAAIGSHRVWLRVADDDGSTFVVYRDVEVAAAVAPQGGAPGAQGTSPAPATPPQIALGQLGAAQLRPLTPTPIVRVAGALTDAGARLRIFSVKAPKGARVRVSCRGRGCPKRHTVRAEGQVRRMHRFERAYRAGTRLEVRITDGRRIGTYVRFTIRRAKAPLREQRCLWPGERAPRRCPSS